MATLEYIYAIRIQRGKTRRARANAYIFVRRGKGNIAVYIYVHANTFSCAHSGKKGSSSSRSSSAHGIRVRAGRGKGAGNRLFYYAKARGSDGTAAAAGSLCLFPPFFSFPRVRWLFLSLTHSVYRRIYSRWAGAKREKRPPPNRVNTGASSRPFCDKLFFDCRGERSERERGDERVREWSNERGVVAEASAEGKGA